jgi:hypothetical protein
MAQEQWNQIVTRALTDAAFKQRLLADPARVFTEQGIEVPSGVEIRVLENTDSVVHLTLPASAAAGELSETELAAVTGGLNIGAILVNVATKSTTAAAGNPKKTGVTAAAQ